MKGNGTDVPYRKDMCEPNTAPPTHTVPAESARMRLYLADVTPLNSPELFARAYTALPKERREKADRLHRTEDKCLSVGAWLLLMRALRDSGLYPSTLTVAIGENGKPYFPSAPHIGFSLSHAGHYALCALSDRPVGCDIEAIRPFDARLPRRFFTPEECADLDALPSPEEKSARFCAFWTLKESFVKAIGKGLTLPLNTFRVEVSDTPTVVTPTVVTPTVVRQSFDTHPWFTCTLPAPDGYRAAICSPVPPDAVEVQTVDLLG